MDVGAPVMDPMYTAMLLIAPSNDTSAPAARLPMGWS